MILEHKRLSDPKSFWKVGLCLWSVVVQSWCVTQGRQTLLPCCTAVLPILPQAQPLMPRTLEKRESPS